MVAVALLSTFASVVSAATPSATTAAPTMTRCDDKITTQICKDFVRWCPYPQQLKNYGFWKYFLYCRDHCSKLCTPSATTAAPTMTNLLQNASNDGGRAIGELITKSTSLLIQHANATDNLVLSSPSFAIIMAQLIAGSSGATQTDLMKVLGYQNVQSAEAPEALSKKLQTLLGTDFLKKISNNLDENGLGFQQATAIFVANTCNIKNKFKMIMTQRFNASVQTFNSADPNNHVPINNFISDTTNGKINQFFQKSLNPNTKLVLVNAVFYNATWTFPFNESQTSPEIFTTNDDKKVEVPMMQRSFSQTEKDTIRFYKNSTIKNIDTVDVVVLPYDDGEYDAVFIKPNSQNKKLQDLLSALDYNTLNMILQSETPEGSLTLKLPKFKLESDTDLKAIIQRMGIDTPFAPADDFKSMATCSNLHISKFKQTATLGVDEKGSTAAAVTGVSFTPRILGVAVRSHEIHFNAPFLFIIRHKQTGTPMFTAIVNIPHILFEY